MSDSTRTFSEVWYRVAKQVITLRPRVDVRKQVFRGERWHVLHDPFNNQFFRVRPEAYNFLARLRPDRTVEEVWQETLDHDPDGAPGQEDVIQLLAQLYHANLLLYREATDSEQFFARYKKRVQRERMFTWWNLMFAKIPLFDPDTLLNRLQPFLKVLLRPWAAVVWLVVVGLAIKTIVEHIGELGAAAGNVLAPSNLLLLYAGVAFLKVLHEFGHAAACKHFGGEVHTMGVMLLVFSPLPYVDVTSSWAFRDRWQRIAVAAGGMIAEFFFAALATFVWAAAGPGVVRDLAFNMMLAAGVTTVLFNANPLLRYDGYYILSDFAQLPNLYQRAQKMLHYLAERHLFGVARAESPAESRRERIWFITYGIASFAYRIIVFAGIIWFVSGKFLLLGMLTAVFCAVAWGLVPLAKFGKYLANSPKLERTRPRAIGATLAVVAGLVVVFGLIPAPQRLRAPGVLQATTFADVTTAVEGEFEGLAVPSGTLVNVGDPLARMRNPELDLQLASARAQREELQALWRESLQQGTSDRAALELALATVAARIATLDSRRAKLVLTAPCAGVWAAPRADDSVGKWLPRGTALGQVIGQDGFEFAAVVPQGEASRLFAQQGGAGRASVRLRGQAGFAMPVTGMVVIQAEQNRLPSAALAAGHGGDIALARDAGDEPITAESFYEVRAQVESRPGAVLYQGLTGRISFALPAEPLGWQWARALRQVFQRRAVE